MFKTWQCLFGKWMIFHKASSIYVFIEFFVLDLHALYIRIASPYFIKNVIILAAIININYSFGDIDMDQSHNNKIFNTKTFQGLIAVLQAYWGGEGCVIMQPVDMEVGAGTFHTASFL